MLATGVIQWTPASTGDYNVTVQADNGVNPDATQSFTIISKNIYLQEWLHIGI